MPANTQQVHDVMSSGIDALTLAYEAVRQYSSPYLYVRTILYINSLQLGQLSPAQYRYVAQRTSQAERLFGRHLHNLLEQIPSFLSQNSPIKCFTLPAYGRMVKNGTLSKLLFDELSAHPGVSSSKICVELSADLLFEETEPLAEELKKIQQLGVGIALTDVGDEFFPILRLLRLPFDYAFLDPYALSLAGTEEDSLLEGLCEFLHSCGKRVFAPDVEGDTLISSLEQLGCDGYTRADDLRPTPEFQQEDLP